MEMETAVPEQRYAQELAAMRQRDRQRANRGKASRGGPDGFASARDAFVAVRQQHEAETFRNAGQRPSRPGEMTLAPKLEQFTDTMAQRRGNKEAGVETQQQAQATEESDALQQALEREVALRREQAASLRELRRMGGMGGRLSKDNKQKVAAQGRSVAGFISGAAQNSDWPYLLVLAVSIINDLVDIFDVSIGLGIDQLFDFACLALMLGARLFIKQHEIGWMAWVASKLFTMLVEWIPIVGIIPTWTISALYVWSYARHQRKKRASQGAMLESEYATTVMEDEQLASEEAEEEYRVAA
ncbi:MAG: hypothetical protein G01um101431_996 [Parcubacteria group bacterium Gr01-1014_31]|nr:MAG: hypothetical protein G01um101431_996 [Parcubacteria group bacterium Gr01-1014_31]